MLGYFYNVYEDKMKLADFELDPDATTKKQILVQTSKVYDPFHSLTSGEDF